MICCSFKAYKTKIRIEGTHDYLRPGMSAKVEILINELKEVLVIPLGAVRNKEEEKYCYVVDGREIHQVQIETGAFNDTFIEVSQGLNEQQIILLVPPRLLQQQ